MNILCSWLAWFIWSLTTCTCLCDTSQTVGERSINQEPWWKHQSTEQRHSCPTVNWPSNRSYVTQYEIITQECNTCKLVSCFWIDKCLQTDMRNVEKYSSSLFICGIVSQHKLTREMLKNTPVTCSFVELWDKTGRKMFHHNFRSKNVCQSLIISWNIEGLK